VDTTDLWEEIKSDIAERQAKGLRDYGVPVTADLTVDWLKHQEEELLDGAVYSRAARRIVERLQKQVADQQKQIEALEAAKNLWIADTNAAYAAMQDQDVLAKKLKEAQSQVEAMQFTINTLNDTIETLENQVGCYKRDCREVEADLKDTALELEKATVLNAQLKAKISEADFYLAGIWIALGAVITSLLFLGFTLWR